jgi:hypothetical protein
VDDVNAIAAASKPEASKPEKSNAPGKPKGKPLAPPVITWQAPERPATLTSTPPLAPTIFHQDWWLDAVTDGGWAKVEVETGGTIVGRLPFQLGRRFGQTTIDMPMLTHFLGPAVDDGAGSEQTRQLKRITVTRALIEQLPKAGFVWLKFHRGVTDSLAFQYAGFLNEVQFTTEIAPAPEPELWAGLRDTTRRVVRRAADQHALIELQDAQRFMAFYADNLARRGMRNTYDIRRSCTAIDACLARGAGRIAVALEANGEMAAGLFTIWDDTAQYYLLTTRRPDSDNGAMSLLIWAGICHANRHGLVFDLDGVGYGGDLQFLTRFGGVIRPRYFVNRQTPAFKAMTLAHARVQRLLRR